MREQERERERERLEARTFHINCEYMSHSIVLTRKRIDVMLLHPAWHVICLFRQKGLSAFLPHFLELWCCVSDMPLATVIFMGKGSVEMLL